MAPASSDGADAHGHGERGDILRTMHRAMKGEQRELVTEPPTDVPVVKRIAAKGLDGELHDKPYLVVDGIDGRAHYLRLQANTDLAELTVGGIVEGKPQALERAVDRTVPDLGRDLHHRPSSRAAPASRRSGPTGNGGSPCASAGGTAP